VFQKITDYENDTREKFNKHKNYFEFSYEDLSDDKQGFMNDLFEKLFLKRHFVSTVMKKQNPEQLNTLVENYDKLKVYFKDTKWSYLFNE